MSRVSVVVSGDFCCFKLALLSLLSMSHNAWRVHEFIVGFFSRRELGPPVMTSAIPVKCSTNWANKPTGSWSLCWINLRYCEDRFYSILSIRFFNRSAHIWFSYVYSHYSSLHHLMLLFSGWEIKRDFFAWFLIMDSAALPSNSYCWGSRWGYPLAVKQQKNLADKY